MSNASNEQTVRDAANRTVASVDALDDEEFAAFVGTLMGHVTFKESTVLALLRAMPDCDFDDFCAMVPGACNKVAAERG